MEYIFDRNLGNWEGSDAVHGPSATRWCPPIRLSGLPTGISLSSNPYKYVLENSTTTFEWANFLEFPASLVLKSLSSFMSFLSELI